MKGGSTKGGIPIPTEMLLNDKELLDFLKANKIEFIDKRANGGALWVIGSSELAAVFKKCPKMEFTFKHDGGKATKGKAAWWSK